MTLEKHRRWFLLSLNFTFVSWGVLFLVGVMHGIFRQQLQTGVGLKILFLIVNLLHLTALTLLFTAHYNGAAYVVRRVLANRRARRRIEVIRDEGGNVSEELITSIYEEEYNRERGKKPGRWHAFSRWARNEKALKR